MENLLFVFRNAKMVTKHKHLNSQNLLRIICFVGGLCRSNENGNPVCRCSSGYTGIDCGTLINRCSNNPCADAATDRCVPVLEGYVCVPRNSAGGCVSTALEIKCKLS